MGDQAIVRAMTGFLHTATVALAAWLGELLPKVQLRGSEGWWKALVEDRLTEPQRRIAQQHGVRTLEDLDLAALLRVADKNWYGLCGVRQLDRALLDAIRELQGVRNNWAHCSGALPGREAVLGDLERVGLLFRLLGVAAAEQERVRAMRAEVASGKAPEARAEIVRASLSGGAKPQRAPGKEAIGSGPLGRWVADPSRRGVVTEARQGGGRWLLCVFLGAVGVGECLEGQIEPVQKPGLAWLGVEVFRSRIVAFQLSHPSCENLYSLNAARIDFVPYQFKPALKLIRSDEPRLLIADSVGVGKTIEAGLIIKELEARGPLRNILIVCPKPLVAERKWELEMRRFDEAFLPMTGADLEQALSDTDRDGGVWPQRWGRAIIPYSILDREAYEGGGKRRRTYGMLDLEPAPHFDLVIFDEAHALRTGSLRKEKAFAYKCSKWLCDHATAVVMLTATPIQMGDSDLFTLLNLLRPDIVIDPTSFQLMAEPNPAITRCAHVVREGAEGWQSEAAEALEGVLKTHWGESVLTKSPEFARVRNRLAGPALSREERVRLLPEVEGLNSFSRMINRTRRRDIEDFCVRKAITHVVPFTPAQRALHDDVLRFEAMALTRLHGSGVAFMMSTIRRQMASCIYGVAPYLEDLILRRCAQLADDPDLDEEELKAFSERFEKLGAEAQAIIEQVRALPEEDPKFDCALQVIREKARSKNNRVLLFSTFRHTLAYLRRRLEAEGVRVGQVDGSVPDDTRRTLRDRFEGDRKAADAIDVLLFTEVGSEGLDYQCCDTMINYDLPWNPMRIEQRIGRIDRRGQMSEAVNIFNIVTEDTVDADIYERCLARIGVFERSIGDCEEILGDIGRDIEKIAVDTSLSPEQRRKKLEKLTDNELLRAKELSELEEKQKDLFGFDLSAYTDQIRAAENLWVAPPRILALVRHYLTERLGRADVLSGEEPLLTLRLSPADKALLLQDFRALTPATDRPLSWEAWDGFLQGRAPTVPITADAETARGKPSAHFLVPSHPLVRQATRLDTLQGEALVCLRVVSDTLPPGDHLFCLYDWDYAGFAPRHRLCAFTTEPALDAALPTLLPNAVAGLTPATSPSDTDWDPIIARADQALLAEADAHRAATENLRRHREESLRHSTETRLRVLDHQLEDAADPKIVRMRESERANIQSQFEAKCREFASIKADVYAKLIAKGILTVVKEGA